MDLGGALALGLFTLYGVIRGLTAQLIGVLVLGVAVSVAALASPALGDRIRAGIWDRIPLGTCRAIGFVLTALLVMAVSSFLIRLMFGKSAAKPLVPFDRLLGGALGALKGAVLVLAAVLILANALWVEDSEEPPGDLLITVRSSRSAGAAVWCSRNLARLLPGEFSGRLSGYAASLEGARDAD